MITRGEILPNERIVEADFAKRLGTNRAKIRLALQRLEQDGLVVSEPNRGARVRLVTEAEAREIIQVRAALEVLITRSIVARVDEAGKLKLQEMLARMKAALAQGDINGFSKAARVLREEYWHISGHGTATRLLETLNSQLVRFWFHSIMMPGRPARILASREQLVAALCAGDCDGAERAMRRYHEEAMEAFDQAVLLRSSYSVT